MDTYYLTGLEIRDVERASEHFQIYDNFMSISPGEQGRFDYCKRVCLLGNSFVANSLSQSGWGYQTTNVMDGFLMTIPHAGSLNWQTRTGRYKVAPGSIALVDQREVFQAAYAPGVRYTTLYFAHSDMLKYLTLLIGAPPKTRIYFSRGAASTAQITIILRLVDTLFEVMTHSRTPLINVANSLKESLIGFVLSNFDNNYSRAMTGTSANTTPTPHSIKLAMDFMEHNTDPHLTVGEVAVHAGLSVRSLQSGFKRYRNTTPIAFLRSVRINKARRLLSVSSNNQSPRQVAELCGFTNYHVFCKYYLEAFFEHPSVTGGRNRLIDECGSSVHETGGR
ncbi:helix-turn-helix transcriptional regulator [Pseudomonas viridiflava]|uniref:helix-turn-helix transcriptional regulator n=1 Tax=Pseudomonas viridiflava TaxID=33069 RepID=UPI002EAF2993|nr:helix-turn-helix domain-containing protein [Pseudomonas viridiflava]